MAINFRKETPHNQIWASLNEIIQKLENVRALKLIWTLLNPSRVFPIKI